MLNTLRKIVQEVNSAKDLKAALGIIVPFRARTKVIRIRPDEYFVFP